MKRFFCITCKKIKRTQKWPVSIQSVESINPFDRTGECDWHSTGRVQTARKPFVKPTKAPKAQPVNRKKAS